MSTLNAPTRYAGTVDGQAISSLYTHVYRVRYSAYVGRRMLEIDERITAADEIGARERCRRRTWDIRGGIDVEHVATLELVAP